MTFEEVRGRFPVLEHYAYLNAGSVGPLARATYDAMVAAERRLVHEYLRDRPEVETYSEGEEPDRHLVVAPVTT